jgi:hypothetical protein
LEDYLENLYREALKKELEEARQIELEGVERIKRIKKDLVSNKLVRFNKGYISLRRFC